MEALEHEEPDWEPDWEQGGGNTPFLPELTVYDAAPEPTGLLDDKGRVLVRAKRPLGFDLTKKEM